MYEPKTELELKKIAIDIFSGRIFCDNNVDPKKYLDVVPHIFMTLKFIDPYSLPFHVNEIGLIYEYITKAEPRSVNGYPIFMSYNLLTRMEANKISIFLNELQESQKKFLSTNEEPSDGTKTNPAG